MLLPVGRVNVCVLDGVSGTDHHAVAEIDPGMAHAGGVVGAFEENQISGPRGMDTTATLGMAALSVIIGALIGSIMIPVYVIRAPGTPPSFS